MEQKTSTIVPPPAIEAAAEGEKPPAHVTTSMTEGDVELPGAIPTDTMRHEAEAHINSPNLDDSHQFVNDVHYG